MFTFALAFCAGAAALYALPALMPATTLAVPGVAAIGLFWRRPALAALLAGFVWSHGLAMHWLAQAWPCERDREVITLAGRVATPAFARYGRIDFELEDVRSMSAGRMPARARIAWYDASGVPRPGERWRMTVRLRCRHAMANPGATDRELDLVRQRLDATGYVTSRSQPERIHGSAARPIERLRSRIALGIADAVPSPASAAVLQGLSVGVRGSIPDALWDAFAATGVAHLMAISGLHVTGFALFMLALVKAAWRTPWTRRVRGRLAVEAVVVVGATAGYALLAGASLPALRTLAMVALVSWLRLMRRTIPLHSLLSLAALVLVATDPLALASAGFWLSVLATGALLAVLERADGWRGRVQAFARSQAAVSALLTPVLAASFGRVSLVAPAANAVAIPFFSAVLLPAVLFATGLDAVSPGAGAAVWRALAGLLERIWPLLVSVAAWPVASWSPAAQAPALVACAGLVTLAAVLLPLRGLRVAAVVMLVSLIFGGSPRPAQDAFTLTVIDVGQGLAAVVETARHVLVFDSGARWLSGASAADVSLVPFLRSRGVRHVDLLVVSHADMDHAGGADTLRKAFPIRHTMAERFAVPGVDRECRRDLAWRWDGIEFRVVHPPDGFEGSDNDRSCALMVAGAGGRALLLADPESAAEAEMIARPVAADVVIVPHHGSRSSSSPALVAAVRARLGIASSGFGNRWGMPAGDVVARWRAAGTTVLDTATWGAITVRFDAQPNAPAIFTERGEDRHWWRASRS